MSLPNKDCGRKKPDIKNNSGLIVLILFILMAIIVGGKFFY